MKTKTKIFLAVIAVVVVVVFYLLYKKYAPQNIVSQTGATGTGNSSSTGTNMTTSSVSPVITQSKYPISYGSTGQEVMTLQNNLNYYFNAGLVVDGIFGTKTQASAYQYLGQKSFKSASEISYLIFLKTGLKR